MAAVAARERQLFAELGPAVIDDGTIVAAGLLADGACKPAFADARGPTRARLSWASIHSPSASFWNKARSSPRAAR